jgi:UDP-2,3-diacylglucosamine hydrolase
MGTRTASQERAALGPGSLVVADLHLDVQRPGAERVFTHWLDGLSGVPRLVVLGDLFEFWVGRAELDSAGVREVTRALAALVARGTEIDVVPGNRDFLLDASFERASGARVRPAGLVAETGAGRLLLLHGDELSTLDRRYQRLRTVLRSAPLRWLAARLPLFVLRPLARSLRRTSRREVAAKPSAVLAMQPEAAERAAGVAGAEILLCGHAHRAEDRRLASGLRWIVLDAFGGPRDTLRVGPAGELVLGPSGAAGPSAEKGPNLG